MKRSRTPIRWGEAPSFKLPDLLVGQGQLRGQQRWSPPSQCCWCCGVGQLHRNDLLPQWRRGALRPFERERRYRNACRFSVHWLVSDCGVNTDNVTLNTGCNTLLFYNPIVGSWATDLIELGSVARPAGCLRLQLRHRLRPHQHLRATPNTHAHAHTHANADTYTGGAIPISRQRKDATRLVLSPPALEIQRLVGGRSFWIPPAVSIPVLALERWPLNLNAGFQYRSWRGSAFAQHQRHTKHRRWNRCARL